MLNFKLCCLYAATLVFYLPHHRAVHLFSVASQPDSNQNEIAYVRNKEDRLPRMFIWLPVGFAALGGVVYVVLNSRNHLRGSNSKINFSGGGNILDENHLSISYPTVDSLPLADGENENSQENSPWIKLKQIKKLWQQLEALCIQLELIIENLVDADKVSETIAEEIREIIQNIDSYNYRIAIIGEFDTGKSTLINALIGEEIQLYATRVRAMLSTDGIHSVITVFKFGKRKRIICQYQDGIKEEIPWHNKYKESLEHSRIERIIIEHPELDLCNYGVEIIDSPGLNEHPNKNAMLSKLLMDVDAAIFLTSSLETLTELERNLILNIRNFLNREKRNVPARNLFVVVNYIERLRSATGKQRIQELVYKFLQEEARIVAREDRIHFISAKFSLDAISSGKSNSYLEDFYKFTSALESFLVGEKTSEKFLAVETEIKPIISDCLARLVRADSELERKIKEPETKIQEIFARMREVNECERRVVLLANDLKKQAFDEANHSWNVWIGGLQERLSKNLENWSSDRNPVLEQKEVVREYVDRFLQDIEKEIDDWGETEIQKKILKPKLEDLENNIREELNKIQRNFKYLRGDNNFAREIDLMIDSVEGTWGNFLNYLFGGIVGGGFGTGLLIFLELIIGPLGLVIAGGVVTALAGAFGLGVGRIREQIKLKVFEAGWKKFIESSENLGNKVGETIIAVFDNRVESAMKIFQKTLSRLEADLEEREQSYQRAFKEYEIFKKWSELKRHELETIDDNLKKIIDRVR